jgi:hypothetical protein
MSWLPSISDERLDALRPGASGWRKHAVVLTIVFFVLTVVAVAALEFLAQQLHLAEGWCTAVIAVAIAEWLIHDRRFFGTGIESALWIGALFAIIFSLPNSGKPEAALVFAAAFAIAGFRVRSAVFGCAAIAIVVAYIGAKTLVGWPPMLFALVTASIAAALLTREWRRPSTERLLAAVMIVTPLAGEVEWSRHESTSATLPFALAAALLLMLGTRNRDRLTLAAGAITAGIAGYEARRLFHFALEFKLIAAGIALIAVAVIVTRALRGRTRGFVAERSADAAYDDAMKILGTISVTHFVPAPAAGELKPGGGSFGGAGASGSY